MDTFIQDIRYGLRILRKSPAFTTVAVFTLALGIGANTAIFSLINAVLLKMLPVKEPAELVVIGDPLAVHSTSMGTPQVDYFSYPLYRELSRGNNVFSGMLGSSQLHRFRVTGAKGDEITRNAVGVLVTGNYFSLLGVEAMIGRTIIPEDDTAPGAHPVAVISNGFWKEKFGQNPGVVGQTVRLNNYPFTIVGVAPAGFFGDTVGDNQDVWMPITMQQQVMPGREWLNDLNVSWIHCIGRLKPGITVEQAHANINLVFQQLLTGSIGPKLEPADVKALKESKIDVAPGGNGFSTLRGAFYQPLVLLMVIVGLVLLIACVNVANLLLARATARQREIAVRLAIGAAPARVVRQLLTESILLAFTGGLLGLLVAQWGTRALLQLSGNTDLEAAPDWRVLIFTAAVCLLTGILFGLVPALRSRSVSVTPALKASAQGTNPQAKGWNWGKLLVTAQVTLSLLVLFAAGLFVRSLQNMRNIDLGYDRQHVLVVSTEPVAAGYKTPTQMSGFADQMVIRLRSLPGVKGATYSKNGLFSGSESGDAIKVSGFIARNDEDLQAAFDRVGPNYFSALGIPVLLGRDFGLQDTETANPVAVVNESFSRFYFGSGNPIGKKFTVASYPGKQFEIVGVTRDARDHELRGKIPRRFYLSMPQAFAASAAGLIFEVVTSADPNTAADSVRKQLRDFNPNVPIGNIAALDRLVSRGMSNETLIAKLSSFFAGLGLLLACIGLYGVMSYSVTGRTREIGVRMALGAQRINVLWLVLREAIKLVIIGIVIGIPMALLSSRLFTTMLYGLKAYDPASMSAVVVLLAGVAVFASYIPARRATKVDPMIALRYE